MTKTATQWSYSSRPQTNLLTILFCSLSRTYLELNATADCVFFPPGDLREPRDQWCEPLLTHGYKSHGSVSG